MALDPEERLFRVAPVAINAGATWRWPSGWTLHVSTNFGRLDDPTWLTEVYEELDTEEMLDVLTVELAMSLGLELEERREG